MSDQVWINGKPYDSTSIIRKIFQVSRIYFWIGIATGVASSAVVYAVSR